MFAWMSPQVALPGGNHVHDEFRAARVVDIVQQKYQLCQ